MERLLAGLEGAAHWPAAFRERHGLAALDTSSLLPVVRKAMAALPIQEDAPLSASARRRLDLLLEDLAPSLAGCLAWDLAQTGPLKGEPFFGEGGTWTRELLGTEARVEAVRLETPEGPAWVHGQVDRLERLSSAAGSFLRVVDYKTSGAQKLKDYAVDLGLFGPHLQLPLYQWMLETRHGEPVSAFLVPLKDFAGPGSKAFVPAMLAPDDMEGRSRLAANVGRLLRRAREGAFPAVPGEHCVHCTLSALCGRPVDVEREDA
jgi:hypothetical protein